MKQLLPKLLLFCGLNTLHPIYGQTYCTPIADCNLEHISNVFIGAINQYSTCSPGGYTDYSNTAGVAVLQIGNPSTLMVSIQEDESDYIRAWIDWNQNGSFSDPGETYVVANSVNSSGPFIISITPPANATLGLTTMRIGLRWAAPPVPCQAGGFGEFEDYRVEIIPDCSMDLSTTGTSETCTGYNDGTITLNVTGALPPYSINWDNGATSPMIWGLGAGTYTATVTDQVCTKTISHVVNSVFVLNPDSVNGKDTVINEPTQVYYIEPNGNWSYQWKVHSGGVILQGTSTHVVTVHWQDPGVHLLSCVLYTPNGCVDSSFTDVYVDQNITVINAAYDAITYYPNPFVTHLQIDNIPDFISEIALFGVSGNQLGRWETRNAQRHRLEIQHLPNGYYFLQIGQRFFKVLKTD